VLRELAELGNPEDLDTTPVDVDRGGFEKLAGPIDRLADALLAVKRRVTNSMRSRPGIPLRRSQSSRPHHARISFRVSSVLTAARERSIQP